MKMYDLEPFHEMDTIVFLEAGTPQQTLLATMASKAISTGVEQETQKMPPRMLARNAPA